MAFVSLGHPVPLFGLPNQVVAATAPRTIDAAGEKYAHIITVPKTGTLKTVQFRFDAISSWGSSVMRVSFQDLTTSDLAVPDETQDQYRDISSAPTQNAWYSSLGIMSSDGTDGGSKRSVTRGETLAIVWEWQTFGSGASAQIGASTTPLLLPYQGVGFPYTALKTGSWSATTHGPIVVLQYDDDSFAIPYGCSVMNGAVVQTAFNSGSNPKERGLWFTPNAPLRVTGVCVRADFDAACDLVFYTGTTQTSVFSLPVVARPSNVQHYLVITFSSDLELAASTAYRFHLRPGGSNVTDTTYAISAANLIANWYGLGAMKFSQRSSSDVFSETDTTLPYIVPLVEGISDGAGSGGGINRAILPSGVSAVG